MASAEAGHYMLVERLGIVQSLFIHGTKHIVG